MERLESVSSSVCLRVCGEREREGESALFRRDNCADGDVMQWVPFNAIYNLRNRRKLDFYAKYKYTNFLIYSNYFFY